jgi:hypothetical protein
LTRDAVKRRDDSRADVVGAAEVVDSMTYGGDAVAAILVVVLVAFVPCAVGWVKDCETNDEISWLPMASVQMGLGGEDDWVREVGKFGVVLL